MKRLMFVITLIILSIATSSCSEDSIPTFKPSDRNAYNIKVDYNPKDYSLIGTEIVKYINEKDTNKIYFHLYPNVYNSEKTAPEYLSIPNSYPNGFSKGYIDITDVKIDGSTISYRIDNSLLEIDIPEEKKQIEMMYVEIQFKSKLPEAKTRFGSFEGLAHNSYWYPILAVYENGQWDKATFNQIGESSYSKVADYEVSITLPKNQLVCATGKKVLEKDLFLNKKTVIFEEDNIRDFAWFTSSNFKVKEIKFNDKTIKYFYTDEKKDSPDQVLEQAANILGFYGSKIGEYPYNQFNIVKTNVTTSEFPQIITITEANLVGDKQIRMSLAHEIAHQWWYLAVGNNQRSEPWLDEALSVYSMHLFNNSVLGDISTNLDIIDRYPQKVYTTPIDSSVEQFSTMSEYGDVVYNLGAIALYELNISIGEENFFEVLRQYFQDNKYKNAHISDFIKAVEQVGGEEASELISSKLTNINYTILSKDEKEQKQIEVLNKELEKLGSGELIVFQRMLYNDKFLYKPIESNSFEEFKKYQSLMPMLELSKLYSLKLNSVSLEPDLKKLENQYKSSYGKHKYELNQVDLITACNYIYGSMRDDFIMVNIFPLTKENNINKTFSFFISSGKRLLPDAEVFFYKNDRSDSAAFKINYLNNEFGVIIMSNIKKNSMGMESIARSIYEELAK
jgi:hypothetical protein